MQGVCIEAMVSSRYSAQEAAQAEQRLRAAVGDGGPSLVFCMYMTPMNAERESWGSARGAEWAYPSNIMRNRALQLVATQQVLLLDADFVPVNISTTAPGLVETGADLKPNQVLVLAPFGKPCMTDIYLHIDARMYARCLYSHRLR